MTVNKTVKRQGGRDLELRFYPRTDVDFTLTCTTGQTQRVLRSRNLSRKGLEVDLEQADVDVIRGVIPPGVLFPRLRLIFDRAATPPPMEGLAVDAELFRLRRTSQVHYVGFFRFAGLGQAEEAAILRALEALQ